MCLLASCSEVYVAAYVSWLLTIVNNNKEDIVVTSVFHTGTLILLIIDINLVYIKRLTNECNRQIKFPQYILRKILVKVYT